MKRNYFKRLASFTTLLLSLVSLSAIPAANALTTAANASTTSAGDRAKITFIITHGNTEISRRLTTLNTLNGKITAATKLTASDQSSLTSEVNNQISGLTSLKTKLDADTDVASAKADGQSIITDYRVYVLVVSKVGLIKTADDQQVTEARLANLATKLQSRITAAQTAGKNVTTLQAKLSDMNAKLAAAQTTSSAIESTIATLQPTDYNSDHAILSGDRDQLKTAQTNIQAAISDAKGIIAGVKNL